MIIVVNDIRNVGFLIRMVMASVQVATGGEVWMVSFISNVFINDR